MLSIFAAGVDNLFEALQRNLKKDLGVVTHFSPVLHTI